jgi:predicted O-methyltransferase YrrM
MPASKTRQFGHSLRGLSSWSAAPNRVVVAIRFRRPLYYGFVRIWAVPISGLWFELQGRDAGTRTARARRQEFEVGWNLRRRHAGRTGDIGCPAVGGARRLRHALALLAQLRRLPPRVALFQWRARRLAARIGDEFGPLSATRARDLATLLDLARGSARVVELGTGSAWTAISLAVADTHRTVVTYDPIDRPERERYLELVGRPVRSRVTLVSAAGHDGPRDGGTVDLLYIDSAHDEQSTIREVEVWRPSLADGALIVFDDYTHPEYPGVRRAVERLGLRGEQHGTLLVHRTGAGGAQP